MIAHIFNRKDVYEGIQINKTDGTIRFVWNGLIRYFEYQKSYLDVLKNDNRFEIVYHGDGPELDLFREYCEKRL